MRKDSAEPRSDEATPFRILDFKFRIGHCRLENTIRGQLDSAICNPKSAIESLHLLSDPQHTPIHEPIITLESVR
jgi:hypothetical protein